MEEEFEKQESVSIQTETATSVENETKSTLDSLPRIEDLRKSEQEIKVNTHVEGPTQVEQKTQVKDKFFTRKVDEKKVYLKKRLKIVTTVYTSIVALLLGFIIANTATLAILNKNVNTNTDTIQSSQQQVVVEDAKNPTLDHPDFQIDLDTPRDYSEDNKELTWLDKVTILFKNIFG